MEKKLVISKTSDYIRKMVVETGNEPQATEAIYVDLADLTPDARAMMYDGQGMEGVWVTDAGNLIVDCCKRSIYIDLFTEQITPDIISAALCKTAADIRAERARKNQDAEIKRVEELIKQRREDERRLAQIQPLLDNWLNERTEPLPIICSGEYLSPSPKNGAPKLYPRDPQWADIVAEDNRRRDRKRECEERMQEKKLQALREWVTQYGTTSQQERMAADVLDWDEIHTIIRDSLVKDVCQYDVGVPGPKDCPCGHEIDYWYEEHGKVIDNPKYNDVEWKYITAAKKNLGECAIEPRWFECINCSAGCRAIFAKFKRAHGILVYEYEYCIWFTAVKKD